MNAIQLSEGYFVRLKPKYNTLLRKQIQIAIAKAQRIPKDKTEETVQASYDVLNIFIDKVYKIENEEETDNLGLDALMELDFADFERVVKEVLEFVKADEAMFKTIGITFGMVELTEEEQEKLQKKMAQN